MNSDKPIQKYSFWDLIRNYRIIIPIIQRDYAQGRKEFDGIRRNFLGAILKAIENQAELNLDFIYGSFNGDESSKNDFMPLDGQQRLTTLFLLHWYAAKKAKADDESVRKTLGMFSYEVRISSRDFCEALVNKEIFFETDKTISNQIRNSNWFFLSWENDSTIRSMLNMLDLIDELFKGFNNLWDVLVNKKIISFYYLKLEDFGLSDDLYIKMNARGKLLTHFENLKAEIEEKAEKEKWEIDSEEVDRFAYKIDNEWTDFIWKNFAFENVVDIAFMRFFTTIIMIDVALGRIELKPQQRNDTLQRLEFSNFERDLIDFINKDVFDDTKEYLDAYSKINLDFLSSDLELWRHKTNNSITHETFRDGLNPKEETTSYTHKVLFYAQSLYLLKNSEFKKDKFDDWMRVIRNIVSRGDTDVTGKRPDIIRSPETFTGVINLVKELSSGVDDIYSYLSSNSIKSSFAKQQTNEEQLKAKIICSQPDKKKVLFDTEDNELLRGRITFALECADFDGRNIDSINFSLLEKVSNVFRKYFNDDKSPLNAFRRAMLTIENNGEYRFYDYWKSFWAVADSEKRKLFPQFREIEYFLNSEQKVYFKKLIIALTENTMEEIAMSFVCPDSLPNWQKRLIKDPTLLDNNCPSSYIAISSDNKICYLLKSQRPRDLEGGYKIE